MSSPKMTSDCQQEESLESDTFIPKKQNFNRENFVSPPADEGNSFLCGVGSWRPSCLQRFASSSVYIVVFATSMMFLAMPNSYFYAITSTVEKVFSINSKVTGVILVGNDVSQVLFSVAIGYMGSKGSRPFWMAFGLAAVSASCFIYAGNHYFWEGPSATLETLLSNLNQTKESSDLCLAGNLTRSDGTNACPVEKPINYLPVILFFMGQFVAGIGNTALLSLGVSYGDDHIKKENSSLFFALIMVTRMMGAFMGFIVAGYCLSIYILPGVKTQLNRRDPRWLGAWWLGFVVFGVCTAICSILMMLLPKKLPKKLSNIVSTKITEAGEQEKEDGSLTKMAVKDMIHTLSRLLRNPIMVFSLLAESVLMLYIGASQIYSSRYMEAQFRQTASRASILTGVFSICIMMAACIIGSLIFSKLRPTASRVSGINTVLRLVQVFLILGQMMLSCGMVNYQNVSIGSNRFEITSSCSKSCDCSGNFQPVCVGNVTFLSPCLAGCTGYTSNGTVKHFYDCTCSSLNDDHVNYRNINASSSSFPKAVPGICASETCSALSFYLLLTSIINILTALLYPASAVILLRSVDKADKSMAMALKVIAFCLIGFFPGPVIYGAVFDSACILRESEKCTGGKGNCWVYDIDVLRRRFLGTSAMVVAVATVFTALLYMQVRKRNITLFDDDEDVENTKNDKAGKEMKPINEY